MDALSPLLDLAHLRVTLDVRCLLGGRAGVAALHAQVLRGDDEGPPPT